MVILQVASVVTTPVTLHLVLPVEEAVKVPALRAMGTLVLFQLLPLGLGMLVNSRSARLAGAVAKPVRVLSTLSLIGTLVFFVVPHFDVFGQVAGGGALATMLLLIVLAWPIGWGMGGADVPIRKTLALGTSLRNIGLCLLIATQDFPDSSVSAVGTAYFLIQAFANFGYAKYLGRTPKSVRTGAPAGSL